MEAWCLHTRMQKWKRGATPACHLQPYTQSDPGALEGTSGPGLGLRRCVSSIGLSNPMKGDVFRSRGNVLNSPAIWNRRTYPRCGWRDIAAVRVRDVE